ncbi:type I polyketide synthase [Methylocapsa polymorpha]|uniref:Type I polyketide synthase n=1 Tax=Methylocapsa polymorpha TaxID=3080828 RepID=A0ABZ0HTA6_9HYPH|nr:type I polyketide synthase [Methylocapsa sp. RX1]
MLEKLEAAIAIIGRACRLPGANSTQQLWDLLAAGGCAVSRIPADRWSLERFGHPRQKERGRSYSWAAGVLDDVWGFDPAVFGISPREAEQMDPQQRLLLELAWEALEDAGVRPSDVAGSQTGVFVGGSALDYGNLRLHDPAAADAYFATGNTLAVLSNRISYVFDLHGPSYTVDTACSSSLVALDAAVAAIQSGRIDTAIVGGANVLTSPFGFISFSQATMLSPTGICQAFSAKADGYVRAEGGVVLILRALDRARAQGDRVHALIVGSRVNSDGRTSGISLPSKAHQAALLEQAYCENGLDPNDIAFIEAHGTGTPVGDPVEAAAIGEVLGQRRDRPLPIGSIKTNIGHTEPASGLAGVMKAMLALEHDSLPQSLHFEEPNPDIPFADLNLSVCTAPLTLERHGRPRYAGVSSFGFGGANAHVILTDPPDVAKPNATVNAPQFLLLSAQSRDALADLARQYSARLAAVDTAEMRRLIAAAGHRRELLQERLAIPVGEQDALVQALDQAANLDAELLGSVAVERAAPVAFVFSGNGSQWPGMGRRAYEANEVFRDRFDAIDAIFRKLAGWSLAETMFSPDVAERLEMTSIAQPLIFAIQAATTHSLTQLGLVPDMVLGHSVGEIAAATAAGILDIESAVRVIYFRSRHQEIVRDAGGIAVLFGLLEAAEALVEEIPGLSIAAHNSPRSFTIAGSFSALDQASKAGPAHKARIRPLDLAYPFHNDLMAPVEAPLLADLDRIRPRPSKMTFISTVEAGVLSGVELGARYWWRNVHEPVRFMEGVRLATRLGARVFVKIGPAAKLVADIKEIGEQMGSSIGVLSVHDRKPMPGDPLRSAVAQALALGAHVNPRIAFGTDPGPSVNLPFYPWRRTPYRVPETCEASGFASVRPWRPLIGARLSSDSLEWRSQLDPYLSPALADHQIGGQILLPGAAFVEMALAAARDWLGVETAAISDLEIVQPMIFVAGASREVLCRATPMTNMIEIMSRPRLSGSAWVSHARAKVIQKPASSIASPAIPSLFTKTMGGAELYAEARRSGLEFGPAYRQVAAASRSGEDVILVDLIEAVPGDEYGLDPARLDACFHGLILRFSDLVPIDRQTAYVPVRFAEVRLEKPGVAIARARIEIKRCNERAIIADFALLDRDGGVIANLRGARFQAMRAQAAGDLASHAVVQSLALADEPTAVRRNPSLTTAHLARASTLEAANAVESALPADLLLIEGWATAAAHSLASALAIEGRIAPDQLIAAGRLPEALRGWLINLLRALEQSGLAHVEAAPATFALAPGFALPDPNDILNNLAADHPRRSAELLLAARTGAMMKALAAGEIEIGAMSDSTIESFEIGSASVVASAGLLAKFLAQLAPSWPRDRALRILQIAHGPLSPHAAALAGAHGARLTIFDPNQRRLEHARLAFARDARIAFADSLENIPKGAFDLVIAADGLHRIASSKVLFAQLVESMASEAMIASIEPAPSLFRDLVFGLRDGWLYGESESSILSFSAWSALFASAGLQKLVAQTVATETGPAFLVAGQTPQVTRRRSPPAKALIISDRDPQTSETAAALSDILEANGTDCAIVAGDRVDEISAAPGAAIVFLAGAAQGSKSSVQSLAARCLALKRCAESLGRHKARFWIVSPGAARSAANSASPIESGFWAFTRTFANEFQAHDVRRIDVAPDLPPHIKAGRLAELILSGTTETEIVLNGHSTRVVRLHAHDPHQTPAHWPAAPAARLEKGDGAGLDRIRWAPIDRRTPGPGEVEIAVAATGLNFRDVMWGLSVLPDEMLEEGFAGPTLGLECAGHVVAVGQGVENFDIGDAVLAFAGGAFATHVTVASKMASKVPEGMSPEAAATIPVAFLTAYYALITCARLQRDEWVLIHGGAGGVGLAALQIARWRGARVIATAGSPEKRSLCAALGAEHVFDSRSGDFVDAVRQAAPGGVAVVLNSLAGEAMERSISLLEPFGRFVELGKRDYLANTHVGLRPFRNNLAYFGVDLDQLVLTQMDKGHALFREVIALFSEGIFSPLPYRSFPATEFIDAMRLMQQSGHIGKIVITPPEIGEIRVAPSDPFKVASDKTHLVTGGLSGFGMETARWLVERGARHLVLIGRSGASSPAAREFLADLAAAGVNVQAEAVDVADRAAIGSLIRKIGRKMPPFAGVIHAAMVLDDALIANLDPERLEAVLRPKVLGAEHLDRLTQDLPLDYFVMFSSATTAIGNPGQASYVAANGFLEGLARRRKAAGKPALAIAWGGIEDVGVLARNRSVKDALASRAGVKGMTARYALNLMGEALSRASATADEAVLVLAEMSWATAREHLPLLQSPTFAELMRKDAAVEADKREKIDVRGLIATRPQEEVRKAVIAVIAEEIAHILRLPQQTLSHAKPLSEAGLDSLMSVELAVRLESRLTLEAALSKSAGSFNVAELADHILALSINATSEEAAIAQGLRDRHLGKDIDPTAFAPLSTLVEEKSRDLTRILS